HLASSGPISVTALSRALRRPVANAVRSLAARATVVVEEQLRPPAGKTRFATVFALARELAGDEVAALGRRAPRQREVYDRIVAAPDRRLDATTLAPRERAAVTALVR